MADDKIKRDIAKELLGRRIRMRREELGMTQDELAKRIGYKSRSTINKIEMGINDITQSKIEVFARELETTPAALMGWESFGSHKNPHLHTSRNTDTVFDRRQNESELAFALRSETEDLSDEDFSDVIAFVKALKEKKKNQS